MEEYWLDHRSYDFLIIRTIRNIGQWTPERVWRIEQVIQRSNIEWHDVAATAEKIAEVLPSYATNVIRAHLDRLLAQAITESQIPAPELPPDTDEIQRQIHAYKYDSREPLTRLIKSEDFYEIEKFAQADPKSFLDSIWPWFTNIVDLIARESNPNHISYREDFSIALNRHNGQVTQAVLIAVSELASQYRQEIMIFTTQNLQSNLLLVHRLLAHGLEIIASEEPQFVLYYLLGDQRRLHLGDSIEGHSYETKRLISSICPYLSQSDRERIENAICQFDCHHPWENSKPDVRLEFLKYNRQERLQLLLAFSDEHLSAIGKNLRDQEIRAFPWEVAEDRYPTVNGFHSVGPRVTKEEMTHASDQDLLSLLDELPDKTLWHHPKRGSNLENFRSGGAIQQSREFGKLAKEDPKRILKLLLQLQPQRHERYVGESLVSLSETDFSASQLIQLIEELEKRNFNSEDFRDYAARALTQVAERNKGLPLSVLALLESWLPTQVNPELENYRSKLDRHSELKSPVFFGLGGSHILPDGRGNTVLAIAKGYLKQPIPDLENWKRFIRSQLGVEPHPAVWVNIVANMPPLLNGNRGEATELFDQVIRNCPEVLQYNWILYSVSRVIGWFEPKEIVQGWLEILRAENSNFSKQAYGELLLIQYIQYQDEWPVKRIREHLTTQDNEAILCGIAHAASHLWVHRRCRAVSAEILSTLASSPHASVQHAVASIFRFSRDQFSLDQGMLKIIQAVCKNHSVLLEAANDLTEIIEVEDMVDNRPEVVVEVCESLLDITVELSNPSWSTAYIAERLTTIAIRLHRQPSYREVGLKIFEKLLALNLRETRSALETLDRKPNRSGSYIPPRRKLRSRQTKLPPK